ncbi:hypothetical protein [Aeromonas hydrophila]|uniref:hypothetical protein n=1 Tax=Aeromonas hydrophila TaxID=644 RepID=UPI003D1CD658
MKLRELAVELFGIEYNNEHKFKQAMIASSLAYAPKQAQEIVMECDIDMFAVSGCAALISERIMQMHHYRYSNSHSVVEYRIGYRVETANDIAAVMMLSQWLLLTSAPMHFDSDVRHSLVAAHKYKSPTEQITRKQAATLLKTNISTVLAGIYNQYPSIELEKLMGIEVLERYKNLR